ncbi:MAG: hypothetical protein H0V97_10495 [Actinobacteria bacterium]|nr:hypothetical protein [Actinomycetota bacterium]
MREPVRYWLEGVFGYRNRGGMRVQLMLNVAVATQIGVQRGVHDYETMESLFAACDRQSDLYLDVLDAVIHQGRFLDAAAVTLQETLRAGYSVWSVAEDRKSLVRRVDAAAEASFAEALDAGGTAREELLQAWEKAYGRNPDPSDCWDHSIKAVEAALVPVVVPDQAQPHLGHVVGQLDSQPERWRLLLGHDVRPLLSMLRLLWPNPDRHGSPNERHLPSQKEAEAVLALAVTIVQWVSKDVLQPRN